MKPVSGSMRGQPGAMGTSFCVLRHPRLGARWPQAAKACGMGATAASCPSQNLCDSLRKPGLVSGGGHPVPWWVVLR